MKPIVRKVLRELGFQMDFRSQPLPRRRWFFGPHPKTLDVRALAVVRDEDGEPRRVVLSVRGNDEPWRSFNVSLGDMLRITFDNKG